MNKVALAIEKSIKYWKRFKNREYNLDNLDYKFNMNYSVCMLAANIEAKAIIAYTNTGDTSRILSSFGPECPIFAITENEITYRQLGVAWNITPKLFEHQETIDKLVYLAINTLKDEGYLEKGDKVIIAGGAKVAKDLSDKEANINTVMGGIVEI
ncbi:MAG: pyruvate kinase alpha/beta domain-containing protein [Clostridia bacterium]|nr:pyruvate kinase alpha/beta domain-containing protein [Clostridia bacterium]